MNSSRESSGSIRPYRTERSGIRVTPNSVTFSRATTEPARRDQCGSL